MKFQVKATSRHARIRNSELPRQTFAPNPRNQRVRQGGMKSENASNEFFVFETIPSRQFRCEKFECFTEFVSNVRMQARANCT